MVSIFVTVSSAPPPVLLLFSCKTGQRLDITFNQIYSYKIPINPFHIRPESPQYENIIQEPDAEMLRALFAVPAPLSLRHTVFTR